MFRARFLCQSRVLGWFLSYVWDFHIQDNDSESFELELNGIPVVPLCVLRGTV